MPLVFMLFAWIMGSCKESGHGSSVRSTNWRVWFGPVLGIAEALLVAQGLYKMLSKVEQIIFRG